MKYNVAGFNQEKLIELDVDLVEAYILRYFVDFHGSRKMKSRIVNGESYYWVKYDDIIDEYPILGLKKDSIYRRLKQLVDKGILKHYTVKDNGTYSYYALGEKYLEIISSTVVDEPEKNQSHSDINPIEEPKMSKVSEKNPYPYGKKSVPPTDENPEQRPFYYIDPSTIDPCIYIFTHWNQKEIVVHKKLTDKMRRVIRSALKDYSQDDICKAIDNYNIILNSQEYFWSHKWVLQDFIQRGIDKFLDFEVAAGNYRNGEGIKTGEVKAINNRGNENNYAYYKEF